MVRIFVGYDSRQPIAYHVLCNSILRRASVPVSITPLVLDTLPIERKGLTDFTFARYLVPWLCDYQGYGLFLDSDMLVLGDVAEFQPMDDALAVVMHPEPYVFERPSVMWFNNAKCEALTPDFIDCGEPHRLEWAEDVAELDPDWNFLVGYEERRATVKLAHYTQGIPEYKECRKCDFAREWFTERDLAMSSVSWLEIMGRSVHAKHVLERLA